jgi:hypothetical protein
VYGLSRLSGVQAISDCGVGAVIRSRFTYACLNVSGCTCLVGSMERPCVPQYTHPPSHPRTPPRPMNPPCSPRRAAPRCLWRTPRRCLRTPCSAASMVRCAASQRQPMDSCAAHATASPRCAMDCRCVGCRPLGGWVGVPACICTHFRACATCIHPLF